MLKIQQQCVWISVLRYKYEDSVIGPVSNVPVGLKSVGASEE